MGRGVSKSFIVRPRSDTSTSFFGDDCWRADVDVDDGMDVEVGFVFKVKDDTVHGARKRKRKLGVYIVLKFYFKYVFCVPEVDEMRNCCDRQLPTS